jgi:hypothetical protein
MNLGDGPIKINAGALVGYIVPLVSQHNVVAVSNIARTENMSSRSLQQLQDAIADMDINPELTETQQTELKNMLRRQHLAFAYGDRKLGKTDLAVMKIETGYIASTIPRLACWKTNNRRYSGGTYR